MKPLSRSRPILIGALALACGIEAHAEGAYLRIDGGWNQSRSSRFADKDCASITPPALFGCGVGNDGSALGASGDFSSSGSIGLGIGYRFSPAWRADANLGTMRGLGFNGNANFRNTPGAQSVQSDLTVNTLMLNGYLDLAGLGKRDFGAFEPYLGIGVGVAQKKSDAMHYSFPGLSPVAATITPAGRSSDFAWRVTVGTGIRLSEKLTLDVGWHYTDLGKVETDAGNASIVRSAGTRSIAIGATNAPLRVQGVSIGLRYPF